MTLEYAFCQCDRREDLSCVSVKTTMRHSGGHEERHPTFSKDHDVHFMQDVVGFLCRCEHMLYAIPHVT